MIFRDFICFSFFKRIEVSSFGRKNWLRPRKLSVVDRGDSVLMPRVLYNDETCKKPRKPIKNLRLFTVTSYQNRYFTKSKIFFTKYGNNAHRKS
jgi:hypothetical protein